MVARLTFYQSNESSILIGMDLGGLAFQRNWGGERRDGAPARTAHYLRLVGAAANPPGGTPQGNRELVTRKDVTRKHTIPVTPTCYATGALNTPHTPHKHMSGSEFQEAVLGALRYGVRAGPAPEAQPSRPPPGALALVEQ